MRVLKKIGFKEEIIEDIMSSAKSNKTDLTKEVNRLCKIALEVEKNNQELYDIRKDLNDIRRIVLYTDDLLKQMFANLDLNNVDIKNSKSLNEYMKGKRNDPFRK